MTQRLAKIADAVVWTALAPLWVPVRLYVAWIIWRAERQQGDDE